MNATNPGLSYWLYVGVEFVPSILLMLYGVLNMLIIILGLLKQRKLSGCYWNYMKKLGNIWLGYILQHKFEKDGDDIVIDGYVFGRRTSIQAFYGMLFVANGCAIAFVDTFLISETHDCDPIVDNNLDCFIADGRDWPPSGPFNCSFAKSGNHTLRCFHFVYDLKVAVATTGGIINACALITAISIAIQRCLVSRCDEGKRECLKKKGTKVCLVMMVQLCSFVVILGIGITYTIYTPVSNARLINFAYTISAAFSFPLSVLPWYASKGKTEAAKIADEADRKADEEYTMKLADMTCCCTRGALATELKKLRTAVRYGYGSNRSRNEEHTER